jgi:hypothetical protein
MESRRSGRAQSRGTYTIGPFDSVADMRWRLLTELANFAGPNAYPHHRDVGIYGPDRTPSGLAFRGRAWLDPYQRDLWDWYRRIQPGTVSNWLPVPMMWPTPW